MLPPNRLVKSRTFALPLGVALVMILAACAPAAIPAAAPTSVVVSAATPGDATSPPPTATAPTEPSKVPSAEPTLAATEAQVTEGQLRLMLAPDGNEARYRVKEQLAGLDLPSDAVGATSDITGALVLTADGAIVRDESKFVVDLRTLRSDSNMRDGFIQRSTLQTNSFPTAEFVPTEASGLPSPLPTSGEVTFQLIGDLTVHGVTNPSTWEVKAQVVDGRELVGNAVTRFTFADYGMEPPHVARVLSIEDTIQLEYDFHLVLASGSP